MTPRTAPPPETMEQTAARERELDKAFERLHEMGVDVQTHRPPEATPRDWDAEAMLQHFVGLYVRNIALHYPAMLQTPHVGPLYQLLGGRPVLVVGAGPSLDAVGPELKAWPGLVIATDRAARACAAYGREADLVVAVDPRPHYIAQMLRYPAQFKRRTTLVASVCLDPEAVAAWGGAVRYMAGEHEGTQFFDRVVPVLFPGMPALPMLGNVGNSAVALAHFMGAGKIALVGSDYAYTGGKVAADDWAVATGVCEADDSWERQEADHAALLERRTGKVAAPAVGGGEVLTYAPYLTYRDALYMAAKTWQLDLVNASGAGILVDLPQARLADLSAHLAPNYSAGEARTLLQAAGG